MAGNISLTFLSFILLTCLSSLSSIQCASFFGSNIVALPLQDARSSTSLSFRFKTSRPDGLLFLAAGTVDYLLVTLESGHIKVRVNLGSGEASITSKGGIKFNDLFWHHISLERSDAEVKILIDDFHASTLTVPGEFYELNIRHGLFLAGLGSSPPQIYLGHISAFRGCLEQVFYNGINVINVANNYPLAIGGSSGGSGGDPVIDGCSAEFEAQTADSVVSFVQPGAFMSLPGYGTSGRTGGRISFDVKSDSEVALIAYNPGTDLHHNDFVAIEIINERVSLSLNDGNGIVVLQSDVVVADGRWHHVEVIFSNTHLEVISDGRSRTLRPSGGDVRFFDLHDTLYLGGVPIQKHNFAFEQGLQSVLSEGVESSLRGCIKNVKVNDKVVGIREADSTRAILVGPFCQWEFPCSTGNPCRAEGYRNSVCIQKGLDGYHCECESAMNCTKLQVPPTQQPTKHVHQPTSAIHSVQPTKISTTSSSSSVETKSSSATTHVVPLPSSATKTISTPQRKPSSTSSPFNSSATGSTPTVSSMGSSEKDKRPLPISSTVAATVPSGERSPSDSTQIALNKQRKKLASQIIYLFIGNISVPEGGSVNIIEDDLRIDLGISGSGAGAAPNTVAQWFDEFLVVEDPKFGKIYHMKKSSSDKTQVVSFTPKQLSAREIYYEHDGSETTSDWFTIVARANKLDKETAPATLHVQINPINDEPPSVIKNTGLIGILEGESIPISPFNLSATDIDSAPGDILYKVVTSHPANGYLIIKPDYKTPITQFSQLQIDQGLVVFIHSGDLEGAIKFRLTDGRNSGPEHSFLISARPEQNPVNTPPPIIRPPYSAPEDHLIQPTSVMVLSNGTIILCDDMTVSETIERSIVMQQGTMVSRIVNPTPSIAKRLSNCDSKKIRYQILSGPRNGVITLNGYQANYFSYADAINVAYRQTNLSAWDDQFTIQIENSHQIDRSFQIINVSVSVRPWLVAREPFVQVEAGESGRIILDHIDPSGLAVATDSDPLFTVIKFPVHGRLSKIGALPQQPVSYFTYSDILTGQLNYTVPSDFKILRNELISDVLEYILTAKGVQPAPGRLVFSIVPRAENIIIPPIGKEVGRSSRPTKTVTKPSFSSEQSDEEKTQMVSGLGAIFSNPETIKYLNIIITKEHLLMLLIVICILLVSIFIASILKCSNKTASPRIDCSAQKRRSTSKQETDPIKDNTTPRNSDGETYSRSLTYGMPIRRTSEVLIGNPTSRQSNPASTSGSAAHYGISPRIQPSFCTPTGTPTHNCGSKMNVVGGKDNLIPPPAISPSLSTNNSMRECLDPMRKSATPTESEPFPKMYPAPPAGYGNCIDRGGTSGVSHVFPLPPSSLHCNQMQNQEEDSRCINNWHESPAHHAVCKVPPHYQSPSHCAIYDQHKETNCSVQQARMECCDHDQIYGNNFHQPSMQVQIGSHPPHYMTQTLQRNRGNGKNRAQIHNAPDLFVPLEFLNNQQQLSPNGHLDHSNNGAYRRVGHSMEDVTVVNGFGTTFRPFPASCYEHLKDGRASFAEEAHQLRGYTALPP